MESVGGVWSISVSLSEKHVISLIILSSSASLTSRTLTSSQREEADSSRASVMGTNRLLLALH